MNKNRENNYENLVLKGITLHYFLTRFSGPRWPFIKLFISLPQVYRPPYSPFFTSLAALVFCLFCITTDHPHSSQPPRLKERNRHFRLTTQAVTRYERSMFPCFMRHILHFSNNLLSLSGRFENGVEASVTLFTVRAGSPSGRMT